MQQKLTFLKGLLGFKKCNISEEVKRGGGLLEKKNI